MNVRRLSLFDQGLIASTNEAYAKGVFDLETAMKLIDGIREGKAAEVEQVIQKAYESTRSVSITDDYPRYKELDRFRRALDFTGTDDLSRMYDMVYSGLATDGDQSHSGDRFVMQVTSFGDTEYDIRRRRLMNTYDECDPENTKMRELERAAFQTLRFEGGFEDMLDIFKQRSNYLSTMADLIREKGHEMVYFDMIAEIAEVISMTAENIFRRAGHIDHEAITYLISLRRLTDRFALDAAHKYLQMDKPITGEEARDEDCLLLVDEQQSIQPYIKTLPKASKAKITNLLNEIGASFQATGRYPTFEGDYYNLFARIDYAMALLGLRREDFELGQNEINSLLGRSKSNCKDYIREFLEAAFLKGRIDMLEIKRLGSKV